MKTFPDDIDDLIARYLAGEASAEQVAFIAEWTKADEKNRRYFEHLKQIYETAAQLPASAVFDTDRAWERLRARLPQREVVQSIPRKDRSSGYNVYLRIAAGVIIVLTVGLFGYRFFNTRSVEPVRLLSDGRAEADTLPDGSNVFLNRETKIEYSLDPQRNAHTARLVGEAYFNIHHDDEKIFIVEAEGTFIRDIGTSFNVKAYPGSPTVEVVVEEGEVMFYAEGNPGVYLQAHGKGIYNKDTRTFAVSEPEPNVTAYKTKFFSFADQSLARVAETLNDVYSTKIVPDDNIKDCRLTVSFNDEGIEEIANIIAETLGLTASRSGTTISLKGPGCRKDQR